MFCVIYLRSHNLFGIFYYYKKKYTRPLRFLVNYCKTFLLLALCGETAKVG